MKIVYRPGRDKANADALSRHPLLPAPAVEIGEDEVQISRVAASEEGCKTGKPEQ